MNPVSHIVEKPSAKGPVMKGDSSDGSLKLTGLWVAVVGVVVTLTGPTASAAEVEETRVAFITLGSVHSRLARTYP